ncbi:MAG: hypothetical protein AAGH15_10570 [Myxococcota bacterium]
MLLSATGVPRLGRYCLAFGQYQANCFQPMMPVDTRISPAQEALYADYAFAAAYEQDGSLYDFARVEWVFSEGRRTLEIAFDGELDDEPVVTDWTLRLPADAESPYRTSTPAETWLGWLVGVEPGTYLSATAMSDVVVGEETITFRTHEFPAEGELLWAMAPLVDFTPPVTQTFRWFSERPDPSEELTFLDAPRLTAGDTWDAEFGWTAPADDVDRYNILMQVGAGRTVVVLVASGDATSAQVPELPSGYDPSVSFPIEGAGGLAQVIAFRGDFPNPAEATGEPFAVDGERATGPSRPFTW